ncbi:MAG: efflux RND transporter periplasmic adaptor subunit [bacterium]|nr:efflux RND transporter periplasmic adaptor subunit [bacterium]
MKFPSIIVSLTLLVIYLNNGCSNSHQSTRPSGILYSKEVNISPLISGRVIQIFKNEGDAVKVGDTLLIIDTELYELQKKQSENQMEEVQAQKLVLETQIKQVEAQLKHTNTNLKRQKELLSSGSTTQQILDDLTLLQETQNQQLEALKAQLQANFSLLKKVKTQIELQNKQIAYGILQAPMDGKVMVRSIEIGETISPQSVAFILTNDEQLETRVYLTQKEMAGLHLGKEVNVWVDAFPDRAFKGTIAFISSKAEFTPKNVQTKQSRSTLVYAVKIAVPNPENLLLNGMPAEVEFK